MTTTIVNLYSLIDDDDDDDDDEVSGDHAGHMISMTCGGAGQER
jgi:hypothetical protein